MCDKMYYFNTKHVNKRNNVYPIHFCGWIT